MGTFEEYFTCFAREYFFRFRRLCTMPKFTTERIAVFTTLKSDILIPCTYMTVLRSSFSCSIAWLKLKEEQYLFLYNSYLMLGTSRLHCMPELVKSYLFGVCIHTDKCIGLKTHRHIQSKLLIADSQ